MSHQVQCANCLCHLYSVEQGVWGLTGQLCESCQEEDGDNDDWDDD